MSRLALLILIIAVIHRGNAGTKTCTYTWVTPTSVAGTAAGTYTASIGAPLSFSMTIDDDIDDTDTNIWKNTAATLATLTSTAAGSFPATVTDSTSGVTATFTAAASGSTAHTYTMAYSTSTGVAADQNGQVISVRNLGCDADSNGITLSVISCNLAVYGDLASAADQTACNYNCQREFTCTYDTTEKFSPTCGADASWNQKYAPCPCAGVREVALLALVMLCSSLSATHMM